MKVAKVNHKDLLKACDLINALNSFTVRFQQDREKTTEHFIRFMRRNDRILDGRLHIIAIGYDAVVTAACDPNSKHLAFRPDIEAYLENKDAIDAIINERQRQREKWGNSHDDTHAPEDFIQLIRDYTDKADDCIGNCNLEHKADDEYCRRLTQVAALCIATIERIRRHQAVPE